jgi:ribosomal protein S4E
MRRLAQTLALIIACPERGARVTNPLSVVPRKTNHHQTNGGTTMKVKPPNSLQDGAECTVVGGTHAGKAGVVRDIKTGKTGHVSITVVQANGVKFKTLAKNVIVKG